MSKIKLVSCELTNHCNLKCRHCYLDKNVSRELSTQEWLEIFDVLKEYGVEHVTLTGGEPLTRIDIVKIVEKAKKNEFFCAITTNGLLLSDEGARGLKSAGIDFVQVSIEGGEKYHDKIRGLGAYKGAIKAIERLDRNKIKFGTMTTLTKGNFNNIDTIVQDLNNHSVTKISFEKYLYTGKNDPDLTLRQDELRTAFSNVKRISINEPMKFLLFNRKKTNSYGGCLAGAYTCAISAHGKIKLCAKIPIEFGEVSLKNLSTLDKKPIIKKIVEREFDHGNCCSCPNLRACGGCRAEAYFHGNILGSDPSCWINHK